MTENFATFIEGKGRDTIGSVLQVTPTTIRSYVHRRWIPYYKWTALLDEFDELSYGQLKRMATNKK